MLVLCIIANCISFLLIDCVIVFLIILAIMSCNSTILQAVDLAGLLKLMLKKMSLQLNNPPFNFMIQTAPLRIKESQLPYTHWFLQIVPQLTGIGGFELGTGCYINPVFPEDAAKLLREVDLPNGG